MAARNLLIDTSIIIDYLRKENKQNSRFYEIVGNYSLYVSAVTIFELFAGATSEQKKQDIKDVVEYLRILPFSEIEAKRAGEIFLSLKKENKIIEAKDLFIGATALSHNMPVMTFNHKHFERIGGLEIL